MTQSYILFTKVTKNFPARCCPQWTVACEAGSVGCCDPAHPWQRVLAQHEVKAIAPALSANARVKPVPLTVFALFSSGAASDLNCLTIDSANGHISALKPVKGPAQAYFGKVCTPLLRPLLRHFISSASRSPTTTTNSYMARKHASTHLTRAAESSSSSTLCNKMPAPLRPLRSTESILRPGSPHLWLF